MFLVSRLFGGNKGSGPATELVQLPSGSLFLIRPSSIRGSRECIYTDALATIRRASPAAAIGAAGGAAAASAVDPDPHAYELVITRAYDAGEDGLPTPSANSTSGPAGSRAQGADGGEYDERVFLIDQNHLHFRESTNEDGEATFVWRDSEYTPGSGHIEDEDLLEFVVDDRQVTEAFRKTFYITFLQCAYEHKFRRSHEEASEDDLKALEYTGEGFGEEVEEDEDEFGLKANDPDALAAQMRSLAVSNPAAAAAPTPVKKKDAKRSAPQAQPEPATVAIEEPAVTASADLYLYDSETEMFMKQDSGVGVIVKEVGRFLYWLSIASAEKRWVSQRVDVDMNMNFSADQLSAVWNYFEKVPAKDGKRSALQTYSWLLRFPDKQAYEEFQTGFAKLMWETLHEEKWSAAKQKENAQYLTAAYEEDVEMLTPEERDALEAEEAEDAAAAEALVPQTEAAPKTPVKAKKAATKGKKKAPTKLNHYARDDEEPLFLGVDDDDEADVDRSLRAQREDREVIEESDGDDDELGDESSVQDMLGSSRTPGAIAGTGKPDTNTELAVGYKSGRSFVVRGNQIGVFRMSDDEKKLEFSTAIRNINTPGGKAFSPKKVMLHDADRALVMMNPNNPNSLFKMDLEVGKVVEEWKVSDDVQIRNAVPTSKFAQMTSEATLIGHGRNSVFKIDPRLSGLKMVDSQYKQYATKQDFSAATTDEAGHLAVASDRGEIRLFDAIGKNAKTALPSIGDPIRGIDVTADGRYVVATCKTYLLLIDTLIGEGRYAGKLGFDRSFPADAKPTPRRLQLRPQNVAVMDEEINFTPARFNTNSDNNETSIVTSSGSYVISWDFNQVKRGILGEYKVRRLADRIVQDAFAHDRDNSIIVAMENDVQMAKRTALKRPTRQSLTTTPRKSRS
ncbi:Vacuolar import and degradation protein 27 [Tilletia horrida]|nr:Vacuolar import and degradation protein 27 [Tilletia horrida]